MRKRKIGKYGHTLVIKLKPQDLQDMGWSIGDDVDIEDVVKMEVKNDI